MRFVLAVWMAAAGLAQQPARLTGVVRSGGLPIPGATVTAVQAGHKLATTTDERGRYQFDGLAPGAWTLEAEMVAFTQARREVAVAGSDLTVDLSLDIRPLPAASARPALPAGFRNLNLNRTVENDVLAALANGGQAAAPAEQPANANEAFLINGTLSSGLQQVRPDDMFGPRGWQDGFQQPPGGAFGQGQPGTPGNGPPGMGPGGGGPPGGFGGGGMRGGGGPGMWGGRGGPGGGRPGGGRPNGRAANFGNRAGRGRQGIHGAAFFSLDNSALDARPFSLTGQTVAKPSYAQSRFGLVAGGPLKIPKLIDDSKTFFFLSYFGTRARNPFNAVSTVPTADERAGDFSAISAPILYNNQRLDGNRIPASLLDPAAIGLLRFLPLPNQPGLVQNYQFTGATGNNSDNLGLRANRTLSQRDRFDLNLNAQRRDGSSLQLFGFQDSTSGLGLTLGAGWTHNFNTGTINSLRVNFSRNRNETTPFFAYGENVAAALGIAGVSSEPINYGPPNLSFTNFGALSDASPVLQRNQTAGLSEGVTLVRGVHTLTFGGDFRRMQLNTRTDQNARGSFTFSGLATSQLDAGGQPLPSTGFDFADFLLGLPQSSSIRFGDTSTYFRGSAYSAYVMDDWRARTNLTFNFGLRYEYFTPFTEKYGHIANLDIAPDFTAVAVVLPGQVGPYSGKFNDALIDPDPRMFSPRVAVAWRPFPKHQTQVRAGYGIFYNGSVYNQFPSRLAAQPPFAETATLSTSLDRPLTIQNGFAAAPSQTILNTYAVARDYLPGYAQTWNAAVQQSLPHSLMVELGYLGTKGTRLDIQRLPNRAAPGSPLTAEQRRRIGNAVGFTFDDSEGNSIYHAGQVRLVRRFSRGLSLNALYTYSKSIDNASTIGGGAAVVAQNDQNLAAERGLSSFDQRHTLNLFYILTSPVGETTGVLAGSRWGRRALADWSLSGGLTYGSGFPFTARVLGNQADTGGTGSIGSGRADATGLPVNAGTGFFNLAAFTLPPPGRYGNAARNTIPGPSTVSLNLSFGRSFQLSERRRLEFRADSRNFLNHVGYTAFNTVVNSTAYGLATATQAMRAITLTTRLRF